MLLSPACIQCQVLPLLDNQMFLPSIEQKYILNKLSILNSSVVVVFKAWHLSLEKQNLLKHLPIPHSFIYSFILQKVNSSTIFLYNSSIHLSISQYIHTHTPHQCTKPPSHSFHHAFIHLCICVFN